MIIYDLIVFCYWSSDLKVFNLLYIYFKLCKFLVIVRLGKIVK